MKWQMLGPNLPQGGNALTRHLGRSLLRVMGWQVTGVFPDHAKLIVAVAPHSTNIDWLLSITVIWGLGLKASYLVKHTLFRFPLGGLLQRLGGIPVDRRAAGGMVGQLADRFAAQTQLVLGITPEGTRSGLREWKRGFALIAQSAGVPVLPAILNYRTRTIHFHPVISDVANVDHVMEAMQLAAASGSPRA
ncbi:MAG: 1-acyl-sn-glycerol-3-phosphate acyltransferase [Proteobacteria bacterium]|nr:1-acyl-sn-glycerol-3-phosphate acyltransferase [Pseudomonadota bacterium]